ncbi:MAG: bleomycin resistance family protein, partial [Algoriella sp.]
KLQDQNEDLIWSTLKKDDVEVLIANPNQSSDFERPKFTGSLYFTVDNVDELWDLVKSDCEVVYEIETFEWDMREFAIYDNNGYVLQFGEEVEIEYDLED